MKNKAMMIGLAISMLILLLVSVADAFETHNGGQSFTELRTEISDGRYENLKTHPWFTFQSIAIVNQTRTITAEERTIIVMGSIAEDHDMSDQITAQAQSHNRYTEIEDEETRLSVDRHYHRAQNHFYSGGYTAGSPATGRLEMADPINIWGLYEDRESAVFWALNSSINNMSISQLNSNSSVARKMRILGHLLHILQDMGVPEHVRNDGHIINKSNIEKYLGSLSYDAHGTGMNMAIAPVQKGSLNAYFEDLAAFTRSNFFSDDSIFDASIERPSLENTIQNYHHEQNSGHYVTSTLVLENQRPVRLAQYNFAGYVRHANTRVIKLKHRIYPVLKNISEWPRGYAEAASSKDYLIISDSVVSDYWNYMRPMIISYSAGFANLFHDIYIETQSQYTIAGQVTTSGGAGLGGVTVTMTDGINLITTQTLSDGSYRFNNVANGLYTVTPSISGYGFSPSYHSVSVSGVNVSGQNFTATSLGNIVWGWVPVNQTYASISINGCNGINYTVIWANHSNLYDILLTYAGRNIRLRDVVFEGSANGWIEIGGWSAIESAEACLY